jgi:lactobin A/cerein 7B family class IIb bacteriocin
MNLDNLNLVELNAQEFQEVQGGLLNPIVDAVIAIVTIGAYVDWAAGEFLQGWNNPR